jgi:hypothetical protein
VRCAFQRFAPDALGGPGGHPGRRYLELFMMQEVTPSGRNEGFDKEGSPSPVTAFAGWRSEFERVTPVQQDGRPEQGGGSRWGSAERASRDRQQKAALRF